MSQQISVRAMDEILRRIALVELGESNRDRAPARAAGQSAGHVEKALPDPSDIRIRQRAHELVTAVAHHQVVGAQARSQGVGDGEQQGIASEVTLGVVDLLQAVHVDEGDHQLSVRAACSIHLALKLLHPSAAPADVSQLIDLRSRTVDCRLSSIARGQGALTRRLRSFFGRPRTVIGCSRTIGRSTGAIISGSLTVARSAEGSLLLSSRLRGHARIIASHLAGVSHLRDLIALRGHLIALIRGDLPRHPDAQTRVRLVVAHVHRMIAMLASRLASLQIATPEGFQIAGGLILLRGTLVAVGGRLVAVGIGLVAVRGRLVAVRSALVAVRGHLIQATPKRSRRLVERLAKRRPILTWISTRPLVIRSTQEPTS